jgi:hypothetical protein
MQLAALVEIMGVCGVSVNLSSGLFLTLRDGLFLTLRDGLLLNLSDRPGFIADVRFGFGLDRLWLELLFIRQGLKRGAVAGAAQSEIKDLLALLCPDQRIDALQGVRPVAGIGLGLCLAELLECVQDRSAGVGDLQCVSL